jgi:hypothetical protein
LRILTAFRICTLHDVSFPGHRQMFVTLCRIENLAGVIRALETFEP